MLQLAGAVPGLAQLAAAAHMGDGKHEAALQQAQARMGKPRVEAFAIGAVAVQVQRCRLAEHLALGHQANGDLRTVGGGRPQALADVGVGIERAEHRGFLEHLLGAAGQLQLADLRRAIERFVAQTNQRAGKFQGVLHRQAVGGIRQLHAITRQAVGMYLNDRQAGFTQAQHIGVSVQAQAFKHHLRVMGDKLAPVLTLGLGFAGGVEREVDAALVAADQPGPLAIELAVVDVVFVVVLARRQAAKLALGRGGIQHPAFAGGLAAEQEDQLALGAGAIAMQKEAPVGFLEHQLGAVLAQGVAIQLVRPVGVVQFGEEQGLVVVGPGQAAVAIVEGQGGDGAAGQVLNKQLIDLIAAGVQAVGQQVVVGADSEGAEGDKAAVGQGIGVEQQLLLGWVDAQRTIGRARAAVVTRVFVAGGGALVIQPRAPGRGQRQVGFADAALDLLEQLLAQRPLLGQFSLQISVFGAQVGQDFGVVALLQPGVRVGTAGLAGYRGVRHGRFSVGVNG